MMRAALSTDITRGPAAVLKLAEEAGFSTVATYAEVTRDGAVVRSLNLQGWRGGLALPDGRVAWARRAHPHPPMVLHPSRFLACWVDGTADFAYWWTRQRTVLDRGYRPGQKHSTPKPGVRQTVTVALPAPERDVTLEWIEPAAHAEKVTVTELKALLVQAGPTGPED